MRQTDPKTATPAQDLGHVRYRSHRCERIVDNDKQLSNRQFGSPALSEIWWDVLCLALILMGMYRPLGVIVGILDTFHDPGLIGLISIGEFFGALISSVRVL